MLITNHSELDWDDEIPIVYQGWMLKALEIRYVYMNQTLDIFQITYQHRAQHHLVFMSDTSDQYFSHVIVLVSQLST